jgi:hypothetical protein
LKTRKYAAGEKLSNPKDAVGIFKAPMSRVPSGVMMEVGLGMLEGDLKYGAHNYRVVGVKASIYYDAAMRHLMDWWEGEDFDADSLAGLHHVSKAMSTLAVIRDSMIQGKFNDDRPPRSPKGWMTALNEKAKKLQEVLPRKVQPYTQTTHPAE